jgi:hypothetical protein
MYTGAESAAAVAAMIQAVKASGVIVRVRPEEFQKIVNKTESPLVVIAQPTFWSKRYSYLTSYRGLAFFAKSPEMLILPGKCEVVAAGKIWVPN